MTNRRFDSIGTILSRTSEGAATSDHQQAAIVDVDGAFAKGVADAGFAIASEQ